MTLLELLVKELPARGGWNINAHGAVQDNSGQVWFYKNGKPEFAGVIWAADNNSNSFDWVQWDLRFKRSEDYKRSIVAREQYEAAIAAQQSVWNGEGLPPVGCECEYETIKDNWRKCRVMYLGEKCNIVRTDEWGEVCCGLSVKFRPIIGEVDRKRESAINAMTGCLGKSIYVLPKEAAEILLDAIAAGKIPGVELSK